MKKTAYLIVALFTLMGCMEKSTNLYDPDAVHLREVNSNASKYFGLIDPNQDWSSVVSSTVTVAADCPLREIALVRIMTESPLLNKNAQVLAEAEAQKGQSVTLRFDVPNHCSRLIAACFDSQGRYFVKGFEVGQTSVSFRSAQTRATRADVEYPQPQQMVMEFKNSERSYNAMRTLFANEAAATGDPVMQSVVSQGNIGAWQGAGWENERLWKPTDNYNTGTTWEVRNQAVVRTTDEMTADEETMLRDLFGDYLERKDASQHWNRKDNLSLIRESESVSFYRNHLTSDGSTPITVAPIYMPSSEINNCHLYYYYYNPNDIPEGTTEEQYIRDLPKFKAIQCQYTRSAANTEGYGETDLFKVHEYLLPYYGEPSAYQPQRCLSSTFATTDGKLFRIRNGRQLDGQDYYMSYTGNDDKELETRYDDDASNLKNQLWQVFTTTDGYKMLYNVGGKMFLVWEGQWATTFSDVLSRVQECYYRFDDANHIWRYNSEKGLGTDLGVKNNKLIATDKTPANGANFEWFFEEYNGSASAAAINTFEFQSFTASMQAQSLAIPQGYRIGFVLRKLKNIGPYVQNYRDITDPGHGCCYSFGGLNREINHLPGHFGSGSTYFSMEEDDPRTCYFTANGKTYIGFEDGSDCQFNDLILEVGGYDQTALDEPPTGSDTKSNGIVTSYLYDLHEIEGQTYTLCFEDRSTSADYDMNDVVMCCKRVNTTQNYKNRVQLTLVAAGGTDDVIIHIGRKKVRGDEFDGMEVHALFFVEEAEGENRFVNTVVGKEIQDPIIGYYDLDEGMTIPQFLSQIYIENVTTGENITVARIGEAPLGIIVPYKFDYPMEHKSIIFAYNSFLEWAHQSTQYPGWYMQEESTLVYPIMDILQRLN